MIRTLRPLSLLKDHKLMKGIEDTLDYVKDDVTTSDFIAVQNSGQDYPGLVILRTSAFDSLLFVLFLYLKSNRDLFKDAQTQLKRREFSKRQTLKVMNELKRIAARYSNQWKE